MDTVTFTIMSTANGYEVYTTHPKFANWQFKKVNKDAVPDLMLALTQKFTNLYKMSVLFEMG